MENKRSKNDEMSRRVQVVEAKAREVRIVKAEGERKERGRRKKVRIKRIKRKEEGKT